MITSYFCKTKYIVQFKDEMKIQSLKLPTTKIEKLKVEILEAYPTTRYEDTALSEITLYNKGKPIYFDLGNSYNQLRIIPEKK